MSFNITTVNNTKPNVAGAISVPPRASIVTMTASGIISAPTNIEGVIVVRANSASTITLTLPSPSGIEGARYEIKQVGVGSVIVAAGGGATIDGGSDHTINTQNDSRSVIATSATTWEIF